MGLYTNNDLPTWPSRVLVVWSKIMKTTRVDSAHAETASEHAANGENAYDVINISFFSHLVATMWTLLPLSLLCLLDVALADPASIPFQDCFNDPSSLDQKFNVSTVYAQVLQNADLGNYLNLTVFGTSPQQILGLVNTSLGMRPVGSTLICHFNQLFKPPFLHPRLCLLSTYGQIAHIYAKIYDLQVHYLPLTQQMTHIALLLQVHLPFHPPSHGAITANLQPLSPSSVQWILTAMNLSV